MIKVIIFDADGVIINTEKKFSVLLAEKYGIPLKKTLPFFYGSFQDCLIGKADLKETISPYLSVWGWKDGIDALLDIWFQEGHEVNQELIQYIQDLRQKGILCILATDNEKYRFQHMLNDFGFTTSFNKAYSSADVGCKKFNQNFFLKIFYELNNIQKNEILFIDDDIENIQVAEKFCIHTHLYTSLENLKEKLSILSKK